MICSYFKTVSEGVAFFAGANTPKGFVSDYGRLLNENEFAKVYYIKGGSGTGKSTLMRRAAKAAKNAGAEITYLLCGSDPDSLDGVLMEKDGVKIAVIDSTAPHTADPIYAGACGEIINCGDCWNSGYLEERKNEIADIINEKKLRYEAAYRYLHGAASVMATVRNTEKNVFRAEKAEAFASRFASGIRGKCAQKAGRITWRRTFGITMKGAVRLDTFERASAVYAVEDHWGLLCEFLKILGNAITERGTDITVSVTPFGDIAEIYIPTADTSIVPFEEGKEYEGIIRMRRFADADEMRAVRMKHRFGEKCFDSMKDGALECFDDIRRLHFALEEIYKKSMDFSAADALCSKLSDNILLKYDK